MEMRIDAGGLDEAKRKRYNAHLRVSKMPCHGSGGTFTSFSSMLGKVTQSSCIGNSLLGSIAPISNVVVAQTPTDSGKQRPPLGGS